jgi:hypothetical protein
MTPTPSKRWTLSIAASARTAIVLMCAAVAVDARAQRQASISIEAEDLLSAARASAGAVNRQDMRGFGPGWSGNAQLFWAPPPPADRPIRNWPNLTLPFTAPAGETFELVLHYTAAPDFATFRVFVDGAPAGDIDAFAPAVRPEARSLGQRTFGPRVHEIVVTVVAKAAASRGFAVGLDRIELRPVASMASASAPATPAGGRVVPGGERVVPGGGRAMPGGPPPPATAAAQLNFATVSGTTLKWDAKGGTEVPLDRTNLYTHLVWESPAANKFTWQWQVSQQPFADASNPSPAGLLAQQNVGGRTFTIDLGSFPPLNALKNNTQPSRLGPMDLYIRLVALDAGRPAGIASNVVVAHYLPGSDKSFETVKDAFAKAEEERKKREEEEAANRIYVAEIVSFTPAVFADPDRWGCVEILKNPHAGQIGHPLASFGPGEHCGPSYKGQGHTLTPWDYITGWAKAWDIASNFYDDAKAWTAKQFAQSLPCEALGKSAGAECEKYATQLAGVAINVGLAAAGVPPSMPNLDELAKGQAVNASVALSCSAIESSGGTCSPKLRDALTKAYGAGLDKLAHDLDRATKESGCNNAQLAHDNGREPLPCFGDFPEIEFRPARGAVYEPPQVGVRITRTAAGRPVLATGGHEISVSMSVKNTAQGQFETYYRPVPPTPIAGELFMPAHLAVPPIAVGRSITVNLTLQGIKQYQFSTTDGGYAVHNGWCALYNGGDATVSASMTCHAEHGATGCAAAAERKLRLPTGASCLFAQ